MGAIHTKIKKLRIQHGMTQDDMADRMNLHVKSWQKIENGITKLDVDRLKEIAGILETTMEDLLNAEDGFFIGEIKDNDVGFNNNTVNVHNSGEAEKDLYERMLAEKDQIIKDKDSEIAFLRGIIEKTSLSRKIKQK